MARALSHARARLRAQIRAAIRSEGGAAAVEMALVAAPFFMLLFGIIEIAMIFLISATLENGMDIAARTIRTGEFQTGGSANASAFKTTVCNTFGWFKADCTAHLYIDVRTYTTFSAITQPTVVSNGVFNSSAVTFTPGGPEDIVVVRAYYQWPLIAPGFNQALQQLNGGMALLTSTVAFRNEPYGN